MTLVLGTNKNPTSNKTFIKNGLVRNYGKTQTKTYMHTHTVKHIRICRSQVKSHQSIDSLPRT